MFFTIRPVLRDLRVNQFAEMSLEPFVRALFVRTHQTRITGHISGEDRGKSARRGHEWAAPCSKVWFP